MKRLFENATATVFVIIAILMFGPFCSAAETTGIGITIDDFIVNDDETGGCPQSDPKIAMNGSGDAVVVWSDSRNDDSDIYGQRYSGNVAELGNGVRIKDDVASIGQMKPSIACNNTGQFSSVWIDGRHVADLPDFSCYMRVFDATGSAAGDNVEIPSSGIRPSQFPVVSRNAFGRTMAVWNEEGDIRAQYFDDEGLPTGVDFSVNDTAYAGLSFATAMNDSGKSVVAWWIGRYPQLPHYGVHVRCCDEAGNSIGPRLMVNEYLYGDEHSISTAINSRGEFVVAWYSYRQSDSTGVYAQLFDSAGVPVGLILTMSSTW